MDQNSNNIAVIVFFFDLLNVSFDGACELLDHEPFFGFAFHLIHQERFMINRVNIHLFYKFCLMRICGDVNIFDRNSLCKA